MEDLGKTNLIDWIIGCSALGRSPVLIRQGQCLPCTLVIHCCMWQYVCLCNCSLTETEAAAESGAVQWRCWAVWEGVLPKPNGLHELWIYRPLEDLSNCTKAREAPEWSVRRQRIGVPALFYPLLTPNGRYSLGVFTCGSLSVVWDLSLETLTAIWIFTDFTQWKCIY